MAYLQQISATKYRSNCLIKGTIISGKSTGTYAWTDILKTYVTRPEKNKKISLMYGASIINTSTNSTGEFQVLTSYQDTKNLKVSINGKELKIRQVYPVFFTYSHEEIEIISDLDDTVMVSYTLKLIKRIRTIVFTQPAKRKVVSYTKDLLKFCNKKRIRINYVSKSESNLFRRITGILIEHQIPYGNLFLTPYQNISQLFNPNRNKGFKEKTIEQIFASTKQKRFILIGDDTQQDLDVYTGLAIKYPHRIIKVYIRKTRKQPLTNKSHLVDKIKNMNVPITYFSDRDSFLSEKTKLENLIN